MTKTMVTVKSLFADAAKDLKRSSNFHVAMQEAGVISYRFDGTLRKAFLDYCKDAWFYDESGFQSHCFPVDNSIVIDGSQINPGQDISYQ